MRHLSYIRVMLTIIAISSSLIAFSQVGFITPANAISNNVVVSQIVGAIRGDLNTMMQKMTNEHKEISNGLRDDHNKLAAAYKGFITANKAQHEQLYGKCK